MAPRVGDFPPITVPAPLPASSTLSTTTASPKTPNTLHGTEPDSSGLLKPSSPSNQGHSPTPPNLTSIASAGLRASPSARSPKPGDKLSPSYSPTPLTGAAAMADEKRMFRQKEVQIEARNQSENPSRVALGALLGPSTGMSRPTDAPTETTAMSEGMAVAADAINVNDPMQVDEPQTSPISMSSVGSFHSTSPNAIISNTLASSPQPMNATASDDGNRGASQDTAGQPDRAETEGKPTNRALTFPGPASSPANPGGEDSRNLLRGMSLPMPGYNQNSPRSPSSSKKHKCPYCSTDFTRHHNLKSHLLTHSHEKPFVCQTCSLRFRRLHDLKRHTKLHTGERPHICPKCGRRFARGDALARHNKGQGGCAGRRSSLGSYGDDDFGESSRTDLDSMPGGHPGDDSMDGLMYSGGHPHDQDDMDSGDDRRPASLPSIKAHELQMSRDSQQPGQTASDRRLYQPQHHPSTYPPGATAGFNQGSMGGNLMPPAPNRGGGFNNTSSPTPTHTSGSGSASSKPNMIGSSQANVPSVFAQGSMTESPKPLSPAGMSSHQLGHGESGSLHRHRSPSLTQQLHQQQYGRKGSGRTPPPPMSLGPPPPANANPPQLPSLPGLAPPDARYTLPSQSSGTNHHAQYGGQHGRGGSQPPQQPPPTQQQQQHQHQQQASGGATPSSIVSQSGGAPTSAISGGGSSSSHGQGSGEGSSSNNLFASGNDGLWAYVRSLEERVNRLSEEVTSLRSQIATNGHHQGQQQNGVEQHSRQ